MKKKINSPSSQRWVRVSARIVLLTFTALSLQLDQWFVWAQAATPETSVPVTSVPPPANIRRPLNQELKLLRQRAETIKERLASGAAPSEDLQTLSGELRTLNCLKEELQTEFLRREQTLNERGYSATLIERHRRFRDKTLFPCSHRTAPPVPG